MLFVFLSIVVTIPAVLTTSPQSYQTCGVSHIGMTYNVPQDIKCVAPERGTIITDTMQLFLPNQDTNLIPAWKCSARKRTICTNVGLVFLRGIVSDTETQVKISQPECTSIVAFKIWREINLVKVHDNLYHSNLTLIPDYIYCCRDVCSTVTNLILTKGDVGTFDGEIFLSNLGHVATCKSSAGFCSVEDGIIVWDDKIQAPCDYKPGEWYEFKKTDLHFIIPKIQGALTRVHNRTVNAVKYCFPSHFILTDQGVVLVPKDKYHLFKLAPDLIVPDPKDPKFAALLASPKSRQVRQKPQSNNTMVDPTNMRLQYLEAMIEHIRINEFRDVWLNLCHMATTQLKLVWQFLRLDPTIGAKCLLNRNDIFARFAVTP